MQATNHMKKRMVERNYTVPMVNAILDMGEWNSRGDQLILDRRQYLELDGRVNEIRRECKHLKQELRDLERLRRKGRSTLVVKEDHLITVYGNEKK